MSCQHTSTSIQNWDHIIIWINIHSPPLPSKTKKRKKITVGMPFPLLPTPEGETSKPGSSMPTKTLRNQCNSRGGKNMWGLAWAEPLASVPFPTLPTAPPSTKTWACLPYRICSIHQARIYRETDKQVSNKLLN